MKRRVVSMVTLALVVFLLGLALGITPRNSPVKAPQPWKTGFWIWAGSTPATAELRASVLYVQILGNHWPRGLPAADEYFVVRRLDPNANLTRALAAEIVEHYARLVSDAGARARVAGLQIDYDCPTKRLEDYGEFLTWIRQDLSPNAKLSITALLDWFGPHTSIQQTLAPVDEFVPQFYDVGATRSSAGIAEPVNSAKWAPILNSLKTPYRIGISSFGRIARRREESSGRTQVHYFRDRTPLDFAASPAFRRSSTTTGAGELVVQYDVNAEAEMDELRPGDRVEITFPTEASVRAAYDAAAKFGGYCSGVIFFRWPNASETLPMAPDQVNLILRGKTLTSEVTLETREGNCKERKCIDLHVSFGGKTGSDPQDRLLDIRASGPMDLFLPDPPLHFVTSGMRQIRVRVPGYSGLSSAYLGRAFSDEGLNFEIRSR